MDSTGSPQPGFDRVRELIDSYDGSGLAAVERAQLSGKSPDDLLRAIARAARRTSSLNGVFDPWSVAPGLLDPRVFDQDVWWVDVTGTPRTLHQLSDEHLRNVLRFLGERVLSFRAAYESIAGSGESGLTDGEWLIGTTLVHGLCVEIRLRGEIPAGIWPFCAGAQ